MNEQQTDLPSELPAENPHYVRAVTDLGEKQDVVVQHDIYSQTGIKLVAKGARINRGTYERLSQHQLREPLDSMLSAADAVSATQLAFDSAELLASNSSLSILAAQTGGAEVVKHAFAQLVLPTPICFRLTVMRDSRLEMLQHSLRVAVIAFATARRLGMSVQEQAQLLVAGLCHDFGEMHTDPSLLEPAHLITPQERRFVHVHPITSYVVIKDLPGVPSAVAHAVLTHHERLDGSGYPYGLRGRDIHPLGKVLAVAEVMDALLRRFDAKHLDVVYRLNLSRFDPAAIRALRDMLKPRHDVGASPLSEGSTSTQLQFVEGVLQSWQDLHSKSLGLLPSQSQPLGFIAERMARIHSLLLQVGFNPDYLGTMLDMARDDSALLAELQATLDELTWQLQDLANEITRRKPAVDRELQEGFEAFVVRLCPA
ncbi:HD domain-containing protein [Paucibacter sediminis]|uniref:HD domain-containing protein n=1 Tax=Paucibacter sediminis TaxID=3019553 RepID=A0AA95NHF8_9BURK|nr:HD domain-containing phosphohydrolase [Paucibacter sp. S2-9]WIT14155.1 HD domain-containing protein [Paucibacter sp. S2-9]